jgi:two-component system KDP operon response regulator KdpE
MAASGALILIIEDDPPIRRFLRISLEGQGYGVREAATAAEGLRLFGHDLPDAIILDLGLPDRDGVELIKDLRQLAQLPIIIVSARGQELGKINALDAGADDYLTKPFGVGELLARLRVALRRAANPRQPDHGILSVGDISMNLDSREVAVTGKIVHLTPHEYRLLLVLLRNAGKVMTHKQLLKETWGAGYGFETHYVRVYMNQLRKKLERDQSQPKYIHTETGVGYRFYTPPD